MAGIDEVLERLVADGDFRGALARDPAVALAGYDLTRADVELLASQLDDSDGAERAVEQRTSKSAMLSFLAAFADVGGGAAPAPAGGYEDQIEVLSWSWGETNDGGGGVTPGDVAVPEEDPETSAAGYLKIGDIKGEAQGAAEPGPDDLTTAAGDDELSNKSGGKVEYTWRIEQGVKAELDPDALVQKVAPGDAAEMENISLNFEEIKASSEAVPSDEAAVASEGDAGASPPSTDDQGIIVINGLEDGGPDADAISGVPPDDNIEAASGNPPDDGMGSNPPDDGLQAVGAIPPDDGVGSNPPDDNLGANPPDDGLEAVGANPPDDTLAAPRMGGEKLADLADDMLEIGDA